MSSGNTSCSSVPEGPTGGINLHFQPQPPQGLIEVLGQALRVQTREQFRCCLQMPVGAMLPWRGRDGSTRPLGAEATQRSLWAHRRAPYLSTSFLSWLKHQLPPEIPAPSLDLPPGQLPSCLLLQLPVSSPGHYQQIVLCFSFCVLLSPRRWPVLKGWGPVSPHCVPSAQHVLSVPWCSTELGGKPRRPRTAPSATPTPQAVCCYSGTFQFGVYMH